MCDALGPQKGAGLVVKDYWNVFNLICSLSINKVGALREWATASIILLPAWTENESDLYLNFTASAPPLLTIINAKMQGSVREYSPGKA